MSLAARLRLKLPQAWAPAFFVLGLFGAAMFAVSLPPYMGPDEPNHFKRADLTTFGDLVADRVVVAGVVTAGGVSDDAIMASVAPFAPLMGRADIKATPERAAAAAKVRWAGARATNFRNTAPYPPTFYLPQSAAIGAAKALRAPVITALIWARLANALACIAVGAAALAVAAPRFRPLLYSVLLLPMSLMLYATATQDGALLAVAALGCALLSRPSADAKALSLRAAAGASLCFALVGMGKVVYAPFALLLLAVPAERGWWRWAGAAAALAAATAWTAWMQVDVAVTLRNPGADPGGQVRFLLAHAAELPAIAVSTLGAGALDYATGFIGVLGWLDTPLPAPYYLAAAAMLALAAWRARGSGRPFGAALVAAATILSGAALFAAIYIVWTPVGAGRVAGVQGRYLLPLALAGALALLGRAPARRPEPPPVVGVALLAFPVVSLVVAEQAILARFYG